MSEKRTGIWPRRPLAELTDNFDSIRVPVKEKDRVKGPFPYYGASGIVDHVEQFLFDGEYLLIAEDGENLRTRNTPVAFVATGKLWVNNHAHIVRGNLEADTRFLMYALANTNIGGYLSGSTMPKLTQGSMNRIPVVAPPLAEQRAIAGILGALDDKIELNRRCGRTLEAMARAVFQSWFVDFDPVHAKAAGRIPDGLSPALAALFPDTLENSALGLIPKGWRVGTIKDVIEISDSKRIPLSSREGEKRHGPYPYYGAASEMGRLDGFLFDGVYVLLGDDSSVIDKDGFPIIQYVLGKFWVNNHAHVFQGTNGISTEHLLLHLKTCNVMPFVTGAVQPKLNQGNMNRISFIHSNSAVCEAFAKLVSPLYASFRIGVEECNTLAALRDSLLPKLISGELRVPDAERIVGRAT